MSEQRKDELQRMYELRQEARAMSYAIMFWGFVRWN